ncbi:MAG: hypothetical protein ACOYKN_16335 [Pirellula sp.]
MLFLTVDDIIESHQNQIDTYGGSYGIRDIGLLESAIALSSTKRSRRRARERIGGRGSTVSSCRQRSHGLEEFEPTN